MSGEVVEHPNCSICKGLGLAINDITARIRRNLGIIEHRQGSVNAKGAESQVKSDKALLLKLRTDHANHIRQDVTP